MWFREQHRQGHRAWSTSRDGVAWGLCARCLPRLAGVLQVAAAGRPTIGVLGLPAAAAEQHVREHACEFCRAPLSVAAEVVEVIPAPCRSRERSSATLRQHRLCHACAAWTRSILHDPSAITGAGTRAGEGPLGHWHRAPLANVVATALLPRDAFVVRQGVADAGGRSAVLQVDDASRIAHAGHVTFVAASRLGRAGRLVALLPRELRRHVIVVARFDCLADAVEALRLGAGDLLASPLSPQQVVGALERVAQPDGPRDHATGLPVLVETDAPFLRFHTVPGVSVIETALLVRRFVRGYDEVGLNEAGEVVARLRCPAGHLPAAAARLRVVLEGVQVLLGDEPAREELGCAA
ncbi:MAG: hypothetical protein M0R74_02205 [Dehalococcoidia bacterium]|nr:hypothetical protein [Dehalococcoidia bacterium]